MQAAPGTSVNAVHWMFGASWPKWPGDTSAMDIMAAYVNPTWGDDHPLLGKYMDLYIIIITIIIVYYYLFIYI